MPAWQALNVLQDFYAQQTDEAWFKDTPLTYSAGVLFCHHSLPILQVRSYARQLCDLAKSKVPQKLRGLQTEHNCLAFLDLAAFDLIKGDVQKFLSEYHAPAKPEDFIIRSHELSALRTNLLTIKRYLPKNKLYNIISMLKSNKFNEVFDLRKRAIDLLNHQQRDPVEYAIQQILKQDKTTEDPNRWFLISDLMTYVGEDDHE